MILVVLFLANNTKSMKDQQICQDTSVVTPIDPCVCNGRIKDKNQIRCNFCQVWFHESCVDVEKDEPNGLGHVLIVAEFQH